MGGLCSSEEAVGSDIVTTVLNEDNEPVEVRKTLNKESKLFIKKTRAMLAVIIPSLKQILHDKEEADMLRQICAVLDKVAHHYHEEFTGEERSQLLLMCVPEREIRFKAILETYKPTDKIRQSRADVDLMRIIRLWFQADEDNSGELEMDEVGNLLNTLGISINLRDLKALFEKVDTSGDGSVQFDEFYELYTDATTIGVVREIFNAYSSKKPNCREVFEPKQGQQTLEFAINPDSYLPAFPEKGGGASVRSSNNGGPAGPQAFQEGAGNAHENNNNTDESIKMQPMIDEEGNVKVDERGQPIMIPVEVDPVEEEKKRKERERKQKEQEEHDRKQKEKEQKEKEKAAKKKKKNKGKEEEEEDEEAKNEDVPVLCFNDCRRFLREVQRMEFEPDAAIYIIANFFGEMRTIEGLQGIAPRQFQNALVDPIRNSWFNPKEDLVTQDMTQPLSHYYIDSSFNTYLTGNQLSSPPSAEMFREALREGCRFIELDVWNGPEGEPIVALNSGSARTITFLDSVVSIAENAFYSSPYPVIISLEIHCNEEQQEKMVMYMKLHFGDALVSASDMEKSKLTSPEFTPSKLLRKILVKTKKIAELVIEQALDEDYLDQEKVVAMAARAQRGSHVSRICAIEQRRFRTLAACKKWPHYSLVSFDETKIEQYVSDIDTLEELANLSKRMFIRSYPKGLRYDSSNQLPIYAWAGGCQVVCMNYQTLDYGFRLNRAKFAVNGHCGYVLKPRCLRLPNVLPNVYGDRMKLTVEIICGVQLPRSLKVKKGETEIPDPYVELWISGVPGDDTSHRPYKTRWIENNTFNPKWCEEFVFMLNSVESALLTVRVMDRDINAIIAEGVIAVAALRMGYRAIPLVAENGMPIPPPSCLFGKFDIQPVGVRVDEGDL